MVLVEVVMIILCHVFDLPLNRSLLDMPRFEKLHFQNWSASINSITLGKLVFEIRVLLLSVLPSILIPGISLVHPIRPGIVILPQSLPDLSPTVHVCPVLLIVLPHELYLALLEHVILLGNNLLSFLRQLLIIVLSCQS